MHKLSERINRLAESATLAMARMSRELKAEGKDVIALSLGEPDFNTPEFIKDAAKDAINNNFSIKLCLTCCSMLLQKIDPHLKLEII